MSERLNEIRARQERPDTWGDREDITWMLDRLERGERLARALREVVEEMRYLYQPHEWETDAALMERGLTDALAWREARAALHVWEQEEGK